MSRKSVSILVVVGALSVLCLTPSAARAQFNPGDFEFTLGASGASGNDLDGFAFGGDASLGYFFTDNLEVSVRQNLNYTDIGTFGGGDDDDLEDGDTEGSAISGSTRIALDYHFDLGRLQPFIGANFGYVYGDGVSDTFEAAPEVGLKWFVNDTTFIYGLAEYQFFFDKGDEADDAFEDGQFVYTFGNGFRF